MKKSKSLKWTKELVLESFQIGAKPFAKKYNVTPTNVYSTRCRMRKLHPEWFTDKSKLETATPKATVKAVKVATMPLWTIETSNGSKVRVQSPTITVDGSTFSV